MHNVQITPLPDQWTCRPKVWRVPFCLTTGRTQKDSQVATGEDHAAFLRFQKYVKKCAHPAWKMEVNGSVFCAESLIPAVAERFRTLRSRLYQIAATHPVRRLLVTSSLAAEGKTFITANLGQSFVRQPNRSVLLIDADLRLHDFTYPLAPQRRRGLQSICVEKQMSPDYPSGARRESVFGSEWEPGLKPKRASAQ